jgi:hypothetical protein
MLFGTVIEKTQRDPALHHRNGPGGAPIPTAFSDRAQVIRCLASMFCRLRKIDVPIGLAFFVFPLAEHQAFPFVVVTNVHQRRRQRDSVPGLQQKLAHIPYPACPDLRQSKLHRLPGSVLIEAGSGPRQMNMAIPV